MQTAHARAERTCSNMWLAIAGVVLVVWLIGTITMKTAGAAIHLLLLVAVIFVVVHFVSGG